MWLRNGLLEMFLREGYLAPLRSCTELDDAVLQVAATIPFDGQDLKPQTFVRRLREAGIDVAGTSDTQFASSGNEAERYRRLQHHYRLMNEILVGGIERMVNLEVYRPCKDCARDVYVAGEVSGVTAAGIPIHAIPVKAGIAASEYSPRTVK